MSASRTADWSASTPSSASCWVVTIRVECMETKHVSDGRARSRHGRHSLGREKQRQVSPGKVSKYYCPEKQLPRRIAEPWIKQTVEPSVSAS